VVHAAGLLADASLLGQNWQSFEQVMGVKLAGAWNLHLQTEGMELDFFVLCSSLSALVGMPGQANYAAANAFLDALAQHRRARGLAGLSINWGRWADVGLSAQSDRGALLDRRGLMPMAPAVAANVLGRLLGQGRAQIAVADINWDTMLRQLPHSTGLLREQAQTAAAAALRPSEHQNELLVALEQVAFTNRYILLLEYIQTCVATVLHFESAAQVPPGQGFFQLGMDSLTALELKNHLSRGLGRPLPATLAFDYPTAAALARYFLDMLFPTEAGETTRPEAQAELAELEMITRDDLKALLDAELDAIDL
jgi:acyl carrier protein